MTKHHYKKFKKLKITTHKYIILIFKKIINFVQNRIMRKNEVPRIQYKYPIREVLMLQTNKL